MDWRTSTPTKHSGICSISGVFTIYWKASSNTLLIWCRRPNIIIRRARGPEFDTHELHRPVFLHSSHVAAFVPQEMTNVTLFDTADSLLSSPLGVNQYCDCFHHDYYGYHLSVSLTDSDNVRCLMQEVFTVTTKPKALAKFRNDALYMKRHPFGIIIH